MGRRDSEDVQEVGQAVPSRREASERAGRELHDARSERAGQGRLQTGDSLPELPTALLAAPPSQPLCHLFTGFSI